MSWPARWSENVARARLRLEFPDTYEKLVALIQREHPTWTVADVEHYIATENAKQDAKRRGQD